MQVRSRRQNDDVQDSEFVAKYPRLWHLAHETAWPGIQRHGLLTASQLVRLMSGPMRQPGQRRDEEVVLGHPDHGTAVLRDQKPLHLGKLGSALQGGMTVDEWLRDLDDLAFFFPSQHGLQTLYKAYQSNPVVVLTLDTSSLVKDYGVWVRLAAINTGSVLYKPAPRGRDTFLSIRRFDHSKRKVKEVAVLNGVPTIRDFLISVERWTPSGARERLS